MPIDTPLVREAEAERAGIPPLSQSRYGDMACETLYVHKHVQRTRAADSEAAARGIEIHRILAAYLNHLVKTRRATDLEVLDSLGASAEAWEALQRFRDRLADRLIKIGKDCAAHLREPFRSIEHGKLLYDEQGLPR